MLSFTSAIKKNGAACATNVKSTNGRQNCSTTIADYLATRSHLAVWWCYSLLQCCSTSSICKSVELTHTANAANSLLRTDSQVRSRARGILTLSTRHRSHCFVYPPSTPRIACSVAAHNRPHSGFGDFYRKCGRGKVSEIRCGGYPANVNCCIRSFACA